MNGSNDVVLGGKFLGITALLDLYIRARYPVLYLVSAEESPAEEMIDQVSQGVNPPRKTYHWDLVGGWEDNGQAKASAMAALERVRTEKEDAALFILRDFYPIFQNSTTDKNYPVVRSLKNLCRNLKRTRKTVILLSHELSIPPELSEEIVVIDFPLPTEEDIKDILATTIPAERMKLNDLGKEQLSKACRGLTRTRIQRILARALAAKQQISEGDIDLVLEEKKQYVRRTGILEFFSVRESLKNVGGLANLKTWVRERQGSFSDQARQYGLPNPKGILLVGIQGTGKSLCAKTIAYEWRMPLLRLDAGRLFGGIVGESESRVRQMIQIAEAMAPCVLWIDEIDKAFGGVQGSSSGDSGTSKRVFGSLITWMQEKTLPVFIVATANNVEILPAELLRRGRFDEIFFLNLPTEKERQQIFRVHLERVRPQRLREFDLTLLASETENFSGAEIEQVIVDAMHRAFNSRPSREFTLEDLRSCIENSIPLALIAKDQIMGLKRWAAESGARTASEDVQLSAEIRQIARERGLDIIEVDHPTD